MLIINESGLYSLILSSKMPKAKAFKHWVTSEVLPAIHKTGAYKSFQTKQHIEQLEATNTRLNAAIQAVSEAKAALANVTAMRDDFIKDRDDFKAVSYTHLVRCSCWAALLKLPCRATASKIS